MITVNCPVVFQIVFFFFFGFKTITRFFILCVSFDIGDIFIYWKATLTLPICNFFMQINLCWYTVTVWEFFFSYLSVLRPISWKYLEYHQPLLFQMSRNSMYSNIVCWIQVTYLLLFINLFHTFDYFILPLIIT